MEVFHAFLKVLSLSHLFYCFVGAFLGTIVGVLPGLGPSSTLAILLPITMFLDPAGSIIMLAGIYYGAMYGGSTTSILVNIPGEASSVVTCFDGFPMTKQGRAGNALWISAVGSFMAGTMGAIAITFLGPGLARYALKFGPPEYFGLLVFSMTLLVSLAGKSIIKGVAAGLMGICLATVGADPSTGIPRLSFGYLGLMRGFELVPVLVGLFGIGEILFNAEAGTKEIYKGTLGKMRPTGRDLKAGLWASLRGSLLGYPLGLLPGMVPALTAFLSYNLEKRISKTPEKFGQGMIEGVAGPEACNNATSMAGFLPMLALGIPTGPSLAIMLAALMMFGLMPGPVLFQQNRDFVWAVIGSMYIGNIMLLILNLPLVKYWARISLIPYKYLAPAILAVCVIGAYSPRNTLFDVWVAIVFGIVGYFMRKMSWPLAPMILGFILGPMLEISLRQSLSMSQGSLSIFVTRPIPAVFLAITVISLYLMIKFFRTVPKEILEEEPD